MKIQFLESSAPGIRWMRRYFREQPQLNAKAASESYKTTKNLLKQEPCIGHVFDEIKGVFEKEISKTHFSIIYAVKGETIYILIFVIIAAFGAAMLYGSTQSILK